MFRGMEGFSISAQQSVHVQFSIRVACLSFVLFKLFLSDQNRLVFPEFKSNGSLYDKHPLKSFGQTTSAGEHGTCQSFSFVIHAVIEYASWGLHHAQGTGAGTTRLAQGCTDGWEIRRQ